MTRISRAMVLAAGLGVRMRPVSEDLPKPLLPVAGRTLIDRVLDRLADAGVEVAVVNTHHLGQLVEAHLDGRGAPRIIISREASLLETGGGVRHALGWLGDGPFFVANGDVVWRDGPKRALIRLESAWDDARMDALLLLQPVARAIGYDGAGDFTADALGRLSRSRGRSPFVFAGVQVLHPRLFDGSPEGAFSLNLLYDRALAAGRLFGLAHDGPWYHVGTPEGLAEAERALGPATPAGP